MKIIFLLIFLSSFVACGGSTDSNLKSGYPDTYPITVDQQEQKNILIERIQQRDGGLGVSIYYDGHLRNTKDKSHIALWIKINKPDGTFLSDFIDAASDNGAVTRFYISNTCIQGNYGGCAQYAPTSMKFLLNPFVQKEPGRIGASLLPLDFEIAFVNSEGIWDSRFGQNYHFTFAALTAPY